MFTRAAALMTHIEQNQCKVITLKDFQRERAERAIEKDAWAEMLDKNGGSTVVGSGVGTTSHQSSEVDEGGGVSLLDSERPGVERDWQGIPVQAAPSGSYRAPLPQATGHSITALSKYPALPVKSSTTNATKEQNKDLLDLNDTEDKMSKLSVRSGAWSKTANPSKSLFPTQKVPTVSNPTDSAYDDLSEIAFNPQRQHHLLRPPTRPTHPLSSRRLRHQPPQRPQRRKHPHPSRPPHHQAHQHAHWTILELDPRSLRMSRPSLRPAAILRPTPSATIC